MDSAPCFRPKKATRQKAWGNDIIPTAFAPGWHSGDCASFVMRNYQGFESLTRLQIKACFYNMFILQEVVWLELRACITFSLLLLGIRRKTDSV